MNLNRLRLRLTLGYLGIFALILLLLLTISVIGFSEELIQQQDTLLLQEARNQTRNLLTDEQRETLAEGSPVYGWAAVDPQGDVIDSDPAAGSLGLPHRGLAREALKEGGPISRTIQGENGSVRAVSMPMFESGELVGVMQYAHSLRSTQERVNRLVFILLPLTLGALGLAALGGLFMAQRASRPVRESFERQRAFIADASHELKTPLTLIRADAEVLQRALSDAEDRELADDILSEADRMSAILSDLLLVARFDAGKLSLRREPFDLSSEVSRVAERFASRAAEKGVRLESRVPAGLGALGDRERAEQILAVLVDNALRHTPEKGRVTITGQHRGGHAEVVVRDTGPGIPPKHLPHVFERFYRIDGARSRDSGGTGLGLAIARDLARAQQGDISVENSKEGGAAFRLTLPS